MSVHKIVGPMFGGKSDAALRHLSRWLDSGLAGGALYVTKRGDQRYAECEGETATHRERTPRERLGVVVARVDSLNADELCSRLAEHKGTLAMAIDEAQFFDPAELHGCVAELARRGVRVVVCGLDLDCRCRVFGGVLSLPADTTEHLLALCVECGAPAPFTRRLAPLQQQIAVGGKELYSAVCRAHHPDLSQK